MQVLGGSPGSARIDNIPSPVRSSPSPPASVKPATGNIVGILADEALQPELKGNEEARRLMQETLLDEATFAAADAAEAAAATTTTPITKPSGSPPLKLSYA